MQASPPISLTPQVPVSVPDPAKFTAANVAVQLQNYSGMALTGTLGGQVLAVPPFTAVTVHFFGNGVVNVTPSSTISTSTGTLTLLWLLAGERSPVPDGPLSAFAVASKSLTVVGGGTYQLTISDVGPSDIGLTIYTRVLQGTGTANFTVVGVQSGQTYLSSTVATGVNVSINVPINGAADTSYTVTITKQNTVAVTGAASVAWSKDGGVTWNAVATGVATTFATGPNCIAMNGDQVVVVPTGSATAAFSTDGGKTWAASTLPVSGVWNVVYSNGLFVAVQKGGSTATAVSSNGGQTWSAGGAMPSLSNWGNLAANGSGGIVAIVPGAATVAFSTNNGTTWAAATTIVGLPNWVVWTGTTFLYMESSSTAATSPTGNVWTATGAAAFASNTAAVGLGGVGAIASPGAIFVYTTNNGAAWTTGNAPPSQTYPAMVTTSIGFVAIPVGTQVETLSTLAGNWAIGTALPVGSSGQGGASAGAAIWVSTTAAASTN